MTLTEGPSGQRLLLVPRWSGRGDSDFYPWLGRRLAARGWRGDLEISPLRPPEAPVIEDTVSALRGRIGAPARAARTVLLGHSVGAQTVMRALADLPSGTGVAGVILVAGWWTVDEPWPAIQPWLDTPFDWARTRAAAARRVVLLSTDDPFTADEARSRRLFEERLDAEVRVFPGARHFNGAEEPAVLAAAAELLGLPPG